MDARAAAGGIKHVLVLFQERRTERKHIPGRDIGPSRGCKGLVREGSEPGHDGQENLAACLPSSQSASLFIQTLVSRDAFMLSQNIDHVILVFAHCLTSFCSSFSHHH